MKDGLCCVANGAISTKLCYSTVHERWTDTKDPHGYNTLPGMATVGNSADDGSGFLSNSVLGGDCSMTEKTEAEKAIARASNPPKIDSTDSTQQMLCIRFSLRP